MVRRMVQLTPRDVEKLQSSAVLITGGAGFIGSNLVTELINLGVKRIIVVDNLALEKIGGVQWGLYALQNYENKFKLIIGDASNFSFMRSLLKKEEIDIVFNLATLPLPLALKKPKYVFDKNVKIASTIAELQRLDMFKTLVHFSSSEVYGSAQRPSISEEHPLQPSTSYGASKGAQDLLLLSYYKNFNIDVRIIRPFNNIGPNQNDFSYSAVVPRTIRRILENKKPEIFGDGLQTRDFIYVKDTCEAALKIATCDFLKGEVLNIGSGRETSIKELISTICTILGYDGKIVYRAPRPGDIRRHCADISKAKKLISFEPKTSLEEALKMTINWYVNRVSKRGVIRYVV
jgi:UDP-glucose 4-epimerase